MTSPESLFSNATNPLNQGFAVNQITDPTLLPKIGGEQTGSSSNLYSSLPVGTVQGLTGRYYNNYNDLGLIRTDATVDFNWGNGSPNAIIGKDNFRVDWTGSVQPLYSELYTFYTQSDDGARLRINDQLLIDKWQDQSTKEHKGSIFLEAGKLYNIDLDYYDKGGQAVSKLLWSSNSQVKQIIPTSQLYSTLPTPIATGTGNGLTSRYYNNTNFTDLGLIRTDTQINFNWGNGSPDVNIDKDTFSVISSGKIQPLYSEKYTFYTQSDDGGQLFINGQTIINQWKNQSVTEHKGTITLEAGKVYDIEYKYYENGGQAVSKLLWSSDSQVKQIIPTSQLYSTLPTPYQTGFGTGLRGEYFDNKDLTNSKLVRTDATIDFNWGKGSPDPVIGKDTFSATWTGFVQPLYDEKYTFSTQSDDGVRVWVNDQIIIDRWQDQSTKEYSGFINLEAGKLSKVRVDYYENGGDAVSKLLWSSDSQVKQIIPTYQLYKDNFQPLIGIIDTGFAANNPDINYARITLGKDRVDNDNNPLLTDGQGNEHGTHILGIIAATQDNDLGIDGINNDAPIWLGRAIGDGKWAESLREYVDFEKVFGRKNGVINMSFDLTQKNADGTITTRYELTPGERGALEYARQNHILVVVAAGNNGGVMSVLGQASQEFDNIITVGAADGENRADYSSYGNGLDILADGGTVDNPILSTVGDSVGTMAGTSVAAAMVTGAASEVWAINPLLSYRQVIEILKSTATDVNIPGWDAETGAGLLDIEAAIEKAKDTKAEVYNPASFLTPTTWGGDGLVTPLERAVVIGYDGGKVHQTYIDTFYRNGGLLVLGSSMYNVHPWENGYIQDFSGGSDSKGGIMKSNANDNSYWVGGDFWNKFIEAGEAGGILQYPTSDRYWTNGGQRQDFQGGAILKSGRGIFTVFGGIGGHYLYNESGQNGRLGFPTSGEIGVGNGVIVQNFENGRIVYGDGAIRTEMNQSPPIVGQWQTAIDNEYYNVNDKPVAFNENAHLGSSTSGYLDAATSPYGTSGKYRSYENGTIHWTSKYGAVAMWSGFNQAYTGSSSRLGFPIAREYNWNGGRRLDFEGGYMYWYPSSSSIDIQYNQSNPNPTPTPTSTTINGYSINGNFYPVYQNYQGTLGNPISGVQYNSNTGASYQLFNNGSIVSSGYGTYPIYGGIREAYLKASGLNGYLGAPYTAEIGQGNGVIVQRFNGGYIIWNGSKATAYDAPVNPPIINSDITPVSTPQKDVLDRTGGEIEQGGYPIQSVSVSSQGLAPTPGIGIPLKSSQFDPLGTVVAYADSGQFQAIKNSFEQAFNNAGGQSVMGVPRENWITAGTSNLGTQGEWRPFSGFNNTAGVYRTEKYGTVAVYGGIGEFYSKFEKNVFGGGGGSESSLGFPTRQEYDWWGGRRADFEGGYIFWYNGNAQAYKFNEAPKSHGAIGVGQGFYNQKIAETDQRFIQAFSQYNLGSKGVKPLQNNDYDGSVHQWRGYLVQDFSGATVRGDLIIDPNTGKGYWIEGKALEAFFNPSNQFQLHPSLAQAYVDNGGSQKLGKPINDLHEFLGCQVQDFNYGTDGRSIMMIWDGKAYYLPGTNGISQKYFDNQWLGKPTSVLLNTDNQLYTFENGYIYTNTNTHLTCIITPEVVSKVIGGNQPTETLKNIKTYLPDILKELALSNILDRNTLIAAIATIGVETNYTFAPVREAYYISDSFSEAEAWRKANLKYYPYYGRGFIQLTWKDNYEKYGKQFDVNLIENPDKALEPSISAKFLAAFFVNKNIPKAASKENWLRVRTLVNGINRETELPNHWKEFEDLVNSAKEKFI